MKIFKIIGGLLALLATLFTATFAVYWFNLDMKLVNKIYFTLQKHYDNMKRDKKL